MFLHIFVWTALVVSGIEWKRWKEIWVVLVIYTVAELAVMHVGMEAELGAQIWYMWNSMERNCLDKDEEGMCIYATGETPADMAKGMHTLDKMSEEDDWDM